MGVVVAVLASVLGASPGTELELRWDAPPQCPPELAVREAIDSNLGQETFGPALRSVAARGSIARDDEQWRLDVEVSLPSGRVERSVTSRDCAELADAAGLIVAVALDPLRVVHEAASAPPAVDRAPQVDEDERPQLEARPRPDSLQPRERSVAIEPRLGGVLEIGSLDAVRGGAAIGVGFAGPRYRIDIIGQYWAPRIVRPFVEAPSAGVSVQQGGGGARGCLRPRIGPVELPTCLGFEAGVSAARGIGLGAPDRVVLPWAAVVFGQELSWASRHRIGIFVGADAMLHVVRPRFRVSDLGTAVRTRWVGARFVVGPLVRL